MNYKEIIFLIPSKICLNNLGFIPKGKETICGTLLQTAKGRSETSPILSSASRSHSEGESNSETGLLDDNSAAALPSSIWPSNVFMSQYSMLGINSLAGLQKILEVCNSSFPKVTAYLQEVSSNTKWTLIYNTE